MFFLGGVSLIWQHARAERKYIIYKAIVLEKFVLLFALFTSKTFILDKI